VINGKREMAEKQKCLESCVSEASQSLGFKELKPQQTKAILKFMEGNDVFVALPTGFGKSVIFGLLPLAFDLHLNRNALSIVVVVSPLTALMMEMKSKFVPRGVNAEFLGELQSDTDAIRRVVRGEHQLVFISPENLLYNVTVREMFRSKVYQHYTVALVVDEAHCIDKWGQSFRLSYAQIGDIRCSLPSSVRVLALTATVTKDTFVAITSSLAMVNPVCIMEPPHKGNITYRVVRRETIMGLTSAIEGGLKEDGLKYPKTLVFCRRYVYECEFMYYCHFSEYKIYPIVERTVAKYFNL
jgi:bloom syndrome protein